MSCEYQFWVYIVTNRNHSVLYIGMTNNLARRTGEHRRGIGAAFPVQFHCTKLIYYERYEHVLGAIARETQLKKWSRAKKIALVEQMNPRWMDLGAEVLLDE
ncbi:MAG: GIY-YIG nuclease family protein [Verrucomicrobia bacterium]|nr:GIY-YIG nuclease family protein [Verrucomicrobiota bacterium]